jgi:cell division septation protein DedD
VAAEASGAVLSPEERALEVELEREVRRGVVKRPPVPGVGRAAIWVGVAAAIAAGVGIVRTMQTSSLGPETGAVIQNRQSGEEPVRSAAPPIQGNLANDPSAALGAATSGTAPSTTPPSAAPPATQAPPTGAITSPPNAPLTPRKSPPAATKSEGSASLPYSVHVASFRSAAKVQEIVRSLAMKGLDAWYEPAKDMPGWRRVFVGRFATEAEAKAYASYLLENHFVDRASSFSIPAR